MKLSELLAVIVIIGILAAITIPTYLGIVANSKASLAASLMMQRIKSLKMDSLEGRKSLCIKDSSYQILYAHIDGDGDECNKVQGWQNLNISGIRIDSLRSTFRKNAGIMNGDAPSDSIYRITMEDMHTAAQVGKIVFLGEGGNKPYCVTMNVQGNLYLKHSQGCNRQSDL